MPGKSLTIYSVAGSNPNTLNCQFESLKYHCSPFLGCGVIMILLFRLFNFIGDANVITTSEVNPFPPDTDSFESGFGNTSTIFGSGTVPNLRCQPSFNLPPSLARAVSAMVRS